MNLFSFLPKIDFESTIGTFNISSFFSFHEYDPKKLMKTTTPVDNKTTLTELSQRIYEDNNSMWLFLIANETTDPFKLLTANATNYTNNIKSNITFGLNQAGNSATNYVNPAGSIVTEYTGVTSGKPWEYSYVGNFDLNGPFSLIDSTDYYSGKMTIKEQKNAQPFIFVDGSVDNVAIIQNDNETYTTDDQQYDTKNKTTEKDNVVYIKQPNSGTIYPTDTEYQSAIAFATPQPDPSYQNSGATYAITNYKALLNSDRNINVIIPSSVSVLINSLKTMSYT